MNQREASRLLSSCFDSWYPALVRYAHAATGRLSLAEDLTQEIFLRLYRELRDGIEIENPKAWLFCVLRNEISKQLRSGRREMPLSEEDVLGLVAPPVAKTLPPEASEADVERLFGVLSTREQEVILLRLASLKYREIAERLGISMSAVNTLLARAIRKLQRAAKQKDWSFQADVATDHSPALQ